MGSSTQDDWEIAVAHVTFCMLEGVAPSADALKHSRHPASVEVALRFDRDISKNFGLMRKATKEGMAIACEL